MTRKTFVSVGLLIVALATSRFAALGLAHADGNEGDDPRVNETLETPAGKLSHAGAEASFKTLPNGDMDRIVVTTPCVKGLDAGPFKDPIDDCADVYLKSAEPVIAEVEGRLGVGAMYWVTVIKVPCKGSGKGSGNVKDPEVLRADVRDKDLNPVLTLRDQISGRFEFDSTDPVEPLKTLYCSTDPETRKGRIGFILGVNPGTYVWTIADLIANTETEGTLTSANEWSHQVDDLDPGVYRLTVQCTCKGQAKLIRVIRFCVVLPDLAAKTIDRNFPVGDLPEDKEENPGAFVPMNDDDDNYTGMADKDDAGAVDGETDLLPIVLKKQPPSVDGKYTLSIPSGIRVWEQADRTGAVSNTTEFDASQDRTVYLEGLTKGQKTIRLNWKTQGTTITDGDRIAVTVFQWAGPLNVPGYSIYRYTASGALNSSKWINGHGGAIATTHTAHDVEILWGSGPVVGKARYEVSDNYVWEMEVNVVEIKFRAAGNHANYADAAVDPPVQAGGAGSAVIRPASAGNAMTSEIILDSVNGPSVNGMQRGRKYMEIGHVHQARYDAKHGLYNGTAPRKRLRSSLQDGLRHWDAHRQGTLPWTYKTPDHYLDIANDGTSVVGHKFSSFDFPIMLGTDQSHFVLAGDQVDQLNLVMSHWTYIAVRSKWPDVNGSRSVLTQRASLEWAMDISGKIDAGGLYTLTGIGVDLPTNGKKYTEIISGQTVPEAEPNLYELFPGQVWVTENQ